MTKNGPNHPVWYDDLAKWNVFLGGSIDGEVRVKLFGRKTPIGDTNTLSMENGGSGSNHKNNAAAVGSKLDRLVAHARDYDCQMNLYRNNCRMFAARMEREVVRLNLEENSGIHDDDARRQLGLAADLRCAWRMVGAALLPASYPLGAFLLVYEGIFVAAH